MDVHYRFALLSKKKKRALILKNTKRINTELSKLVLTEIKANGINRALIGIVVSFLCVIKRFKELTNGMYHLI